MVDEIQVITLNRVLNTYRRKDVENAAEIKSLRNVVHSISTFRFFEVSADRIAFECRLKKAKK